MLFIYWFGVPFRAIGIRNYGELTQSSWNFIVLYLMLQKAYFYCNRVVLYSTYFTYIIFYIYLVFSIVLPVILHISLINWVSELKYDYKQFNSNFFVFSTNTSYLWWINILKIYVSSWKIALKTFPRVVMKHNTRKIRRKIRSHYDIFMKPWIK